jgi:hypothetical protein
MFGKDTKSHEMAESKSKKYQGNDRGKEVAERYMNQEKKKKEGGSAVVGS